MYSSMSHPRRSGSSSVRVGQTGPDNDLVKRTFARTGASVTGTRMFDGGERFWPEEAPFHHPVFVLTHQAREPWLRPGTTFTFVNSGGESGMHKALAQATEAAAGKDVRIAGGGDVVRQFLNAELVDEFTLSIAPIVLGGGVRLFDGIDRTKVGLEVAGVIASGTVHPRDLPLHPGVEHCPPFSGGRGRVRGSVTGAARRHVLGPFG